MIYEVFIPALDRDGYDVTLTIEADNWMMALKSGLAKTGESDDITRNVMCDIKQDNSIHVTDATTRRVFVLRELDEERLGALTEMMPAISADSGPRKTVTLDSSISEPPQPVVEQPKVVVEQPEVGVEQPEVGVEQPKVGVEQPSKNAFENSEVSSERLRIGSNTMSALQRDEPLPRVLGEKRSPTGERPAPTKPRLERVSDNIMEEVFLEITRIHDGEMSMEQVVNFVMDLAMEKVGAEAGSIMLADINGRELYFATARGPKAADVMSFRIPMGKGIAGFCAREGVSIAISDAQEDPRFYKEISEALGYPTKSLCCAPIQIEGRVFGAIELLNSNDNRFSSTEMNVLTYMGKQLARYIYDLIMAREPLE